MGLSQSKNNSKSKAKASTKQEASPREKQSNKMSTGTPEMKNDAPRPAAPTMKADSVASPKQDMKGPAKAYSSHPATNEKISQLFLPEYKQIYITPPNNWPKYPPKGSVSAEYPEGDFFIDLYPKAEEVAKGIKDDKGFEPRNYKINLQQDPRDPKRQAMPLDFCSPTKSLYGADGKPRPPVVEWLNVKYRNEFDHLLSAEEVHDLIRRRGITYQNVWFFDEDDVYELVFDEKGRPINPVPRCESLNVTGPGFYFWVGPNFAVDITFTLQHQGEVYLFVIHGKGDAENMLRLVGGMRDIDKNNVAQRMFIELHEETGVQMDQVALERDRRMERITSKITDESRATRNAYTQTIFSAVRFQSLEDIRKYTVKIDPQENHEADQRFLINLRYLYEHHLREGAPGKMFAGHDKLILELIRKDAALERYVMNEEKLAEWRGKTRSEASLDLNHLLISK